MHQVALRDTSTWGTIATQWEWWLKVMHQAGVEFTCRCNYLSQSDTRLAPQYIITWRLQWKCSIFLTLIMMVTFWRTSRICLKRSLFLNWGWRRGNKRHSTLYFCYFILRILSWCSFVRRVLCIRNPDNYHALAVKKHGLKCRAKIIHSSTSFSVIPLPLHAIRVKGSRFHW